jgi:hypothetical protein
VYEFIAPDVGVESKVNAILDLQDAIFEYLGGILGEVNLVTSIGQDYLTVDVASYPVRHYKQPIALRIAKLDDGRFLLSHREYPI